MAVRLLALVSILLLAAFAHSSFSDKDDLQLELTKELFESWLAEHGKVYSGCVKEQRFAIFKDNLEYINKQNLDNGSYSLGLNKFADLSNNEFRAKHVGKLMRRSPQRNDVSSYEMDENTTSLPAYIDWRKYGAVTAIKDQGACGSCWAFSAVAAVESLNYLVHRKLISLSEQQLVDCDTEEDEGCDGGLMDDAFQYIINNGGLTTEDDYPYKAQGGSCNQNKEKSHAVTIDGFEDVPAKDENSLLKAVARMPVSVAIDAGGRDFQFYKNGIFTGSCGTDLDHGVAAVGYGTASDGKKYWIVKNSWGSGWGESGYIRMERLGQGDGLCGINLMASYPTLSRSSLACHEDHEDH